MRTRSGVLTAASSRSVRLLAALAVVTVGSACASFGPQIPPPPRAALTFDNQSPDPVRVYLVVEDAGEYLLGRVYPMQSGSLRLPRHLPVQDNQRVSLVVVPLAANSFAQRLPRGPHSREVVARLSELTMQRYVITPLALHGTVGGLRSFP